MHSFRIFFCTLWLYLLPGYWEVVVAQNFDFTYQMSGDRRIAPVQVFHDGQNTYLQFREDQPIPAIIAPGASQSLVPYARHHQYIIVAGIHPLLELQLYGNRATIQYVGQQVTTHHSATVPHPPPNGYLAPTPAVHPAPNAPAPNAPAAHTYPVASPVAPPVTPIPQPYPAQASPVQPPPQQAYPASPYPVQPYATMPTAQGFSISIADKNFRLALKKWAQMSGWSFLNEHWAVPFDIPISASAQFQGDFRQAVRGLLAATELTDHPLQPCFYSNQVVRVIRWIESCDPKGVQS